MQSDFNLNETVVQTAKKIINDEIDLIEGARFIVDNRWDLSVSGDNKVFYPLIGFVSETDQIPDTDIRKNFSENYLAQADQKKSEYVGRMSQEIKATCLEIIEHIEDESRPKI